MKPEAQRIAIAEACGWAKDISINGNQTWSSRRDKLRQVHELPDYLNDLNAMHEAEKVLTAEQQKDYVQWLLVITVATDNPLAHDWNATAAQRAEAFLRTLNLWND